MMSSFSKRYANDKKYASFGGYDNYLDGDGYDEIHNDPDECELCNNKAKPGSPYCSRQCERIADALDEGNFKGMISQGYPDPNECDLCHDKAKIFTRSGENFCADCNPYDNVSCDYCGAPGDFLSRSGESFCDDCNPYDR
jgi:hypothetical protein